MLRSSAVQHSNLFGDRASLVTVDTRRLPQPNPEPELERPSEPPATCRSIVVTS